MKKLCGEALSFVFLQFNFALKSEQIGRFAPIVLAGTIVFRTKKIEETVFLVGQAKSHNCCLIKTFNHEVLTNEN